LNTVLVYTTFSFNQNIAEAVILEATSFPKSGYSNCSLLFENEESGSYGLKDRKTVVQYSDPTLQLTDCEYVSGL
jgi:hypothetical protein